MKLLNINLFVVHCLLPALISFSFGKNRDGYSFSQSPAWAWARSSGAFENISKSITTDATGNVLATGYFINSTVFGADTLTSKGGYDIFLVKYDGNGNVLWAKSEGGTGDERAVSVVTDAAGSVLVAGYFKDAPVIFGTDTFASMGFNDIFLAKYDSNGNLLWAKREGGTENDYAVSIITDAMSNVFVSGTFGTSIIFGTDTLANSGNDDIFFTKYDSDGNITWAKSIGGNWAEDDWVTSIAMDNSGNIFLTAYLVGDTFIFASDTFVNPLGSVFILVKYDGNGNALWAKTSNGIFGFAQLIYHSVTADNSGNAYLTGMNFFPVFFGSDTVSSMIFLLKYDSDGNELWARGTTGGNAGEGMSVFTDNEDNVIMTGYFNSPSVSFGSFLLTNYSDTGDVFLVKYDSNGNVFGAASAGGSGFDMGYSVTADNLNNIYLTGIFESPSIAFGSDILTNPAGTKMFIAKMSDITQVEEGNFNNRALSFFPNPFNGETPVQIMNVSEFISEKTELKMYDVLGQEVFHSLLRSPESRLDLKNLSNGIYFYRIADDKKQIRTGKIVKQ